MSPLIYWAEPAEGATFHAHLPNSIWEAWSQFACACECHMGVAKSVDCAKRRFPHGHGQSKGISQCEFRSYQAPGALVLAIARWSHVGLQRRGRAHTDNERRSLVWLQLGFLWHMGIYRAYSRPFNNRELQEFRMDPTHASQLLGICGT